MKNKKIVYYSIIKKTDIKANNIIDNSETNQAITVLKQQLKHFNLEIPEIYISSHGKPYFKNSNIYFNYSHSKNYIACAISHYEVGIDIEETTRIISDKIAKKYLNNEKENLKRVEMWVKKEAYSKLKGLGIQIEFQNIKLSEITEKSIFITTKDYLCSIYCDNNEVEFKELCFNGDELLKKI